MSKKNKKPEFLVETDILLDHLTFSGKGLSKLEIAMMNGLCFTTVLNASELLYAAKNEEERQVVISMLSAVKVLGLHSRYSLSVYEFSNKVKSLRDAIFCVVAKLNKLPILTDDNEKFVNSGIKIINIKDLRG